MSRSRLVVSATLGLLLTLALLWVLRGAPCTAIAHSDPVSVPASLNRQHDPIVIAGSVLSDLIGSPVQDIFVYAHQGTTLAQVPFQIDERDGRGTYVVVEDNQLDDNDELVFMAADGGGRVDHPLLNAGGTTLLATHVVTLTDPIDAGQAWVYIFRSEALTRTFSADYVSYEVITDRIVGPGLYALGFDTTHGFPDHLALGGEDTDLLDRAKLRITGTAWGWPFSINEENVTLDNVHALDGPVRVTRVSTVTLAALGRSISSVTALFAYRSLVVQPSPTIIPGAFAQTTYMRASVDWSEQVSGAVYYDANNPAGVTIDGLPDTITTTPPTRWTQVTAMTGTVVNVSTLPAGLGGISSTYYRDDSAVDPSDTGDQRSYGDAGLQVENPTPGVYTTTGQTYVLTGTIGSVGSTYETYHDHPIQVSVESIPPIRYAYLPFLARE